MTGLDYGIFALYMAAILGIGFFFFFRNRSREDYYVGFPAVSGPEARGGCACLM